MLSAAFWNKSAQWNTFWHNGLHFFFCSQCGLIIFWFNLSAASLLRGWRKGGFYFVCNIIVVNLYNALLILTTFTGFCFLFYRNIQWIIRWGTVTSIAIWLVVNICYIFITIAVWIRLNDFSSSFQFQLNYITLMTRKVAEGTRGPFYTIGRFSDHHWPE